MALFGKKKTEYPKFPEGDCKPVLRCSICTGEQVLCAKDTRTGHLSELMLIRTPGELEGFCEANHIPLESIEKVY